MIEYVVVCLVALGASALTLFSGFGLGTLLLPAFLIFFDAPIAVAMTAVVHFANNLAKLGLVGRFADRTVVRRFGVPAILASLVGARLLVTLSRRGPIATYPLFGREHDVTVIGVVVGSLIAVFALWEAAPRLARLSVPPAYLPVGGALSGFFGGLSGHQGALRSAFLIRSGLSKEAYIGTGVVIACLVDIARLALYGREIGFATVRGEWRLAAAALAFAVAGAFTGARLLPSVSMGFVRGVTTVLLFLVAFAIATGLT
jgi:uncharacterized membrane protein YfcA